MRELLQSGQVRRVWGRGDVYRYEFPLDPPEDGLEQLTVPIVPTEALLMTRRRNAYERCTLGSWYDVYARWCRRHGGRPVTLNEFPRAVRRVATARTVSKQPVQYSRVEGVSLEEERLSLKRTE